MNNSKYYISLDVHKTVSQSSIPVKRGDNSLTICASLTDNGREYVIAEDCTAVFTAAKPDRKSLYNYCTVEDNAITYVITDQTTATVGQVECEFRLMNAEGKLLTSPRFTLIVEDAVADDRVVVSSDEFTELARIIGKVDSAEETAQEALDTAEEALEKSNRASDLVDGCEEATNTLVLTYEDVVSGGYIEALKERNTGGKFSFWVGTTDEYNSLEKKANNCLYLLTDDSTRAELNMRLDQHDYRLEKAESTLAILEAKTLANNPVTFDQIHSEFFALEPTKVYLVVVASIGNGSPYGGGVYVVVTGGNIDTYPEAQGLVIPICPQSNFEVSVSAGPAGYSLSINNQTNSYAIISVTKL